MSLVTLAILVLYFVYPQIDYSPLENRTMARFSTLKDTSYFEGSFQTNLEEALKDQLSFRDPVIISYNGFKGNTRKWYNSVAGFFRNAGSFVAGVFSSNPTSPTDPNGTKPVGSETTGMEKPTAPSETTDAEIPNGYSDTKEYLSTAEDAGWQQTGLKLDKAYSGSVSIEFDMSTSTDMVDGSVDFTDMDFDVQGFGDLAMLVRMYEGFFDVRNGDIGQQADSFVPVVPNEIYHVEIKADLSSKTYTVFVTQTGSEREMIAENYAFRSTAAHADDVGQVYVISANESGLVKLTNLKVNGEAGGTAPQPTETTAPTSEQPATEPGTSEPTTVPGTTNLQGEFWLEPSGSVYKINGTNQLTYYPFLQNSAKKNNYKIFGNQISEFAKNNPGVKVYAYYINKTEDLNWFDKSEKIKSFDYSEYLKSFLSDTVTFGEFELTSLADVEKYLYNTDHHWNHVGAQKGYTQIINMFRNDFPEISEAKEPVKEEDWGRNIKWYGSKWKAGGGADVEPDSFKAYIYDLGDFKAFFGGSTGDIGLADQYAAGSISTSLSYDHYVNYYGFESQLIRFKRITPENDINMLLVGDSNNRPIRRVLGSHFANFHFIEKRLMNNYNLDDYVEKNDIDLVLFLGESDFWEQHRIAGYPTKY